MANLVSRIDGSKHSVTTHGVKRRLTDPFD